MKENNQNKNEPTLFINTVCDKKGGNENQEIFDSRKKKEEVKESVTRRKKIAQYRLDDIHAMLLYKINISCEIVTINNEYNGLIKSIDDNFINVKVDDKLVNILIEEIEDIKIIGT